MTTVNQRRAKSQRISDHLSKRPRKDTTAAKVRQVRRTLTERRNAYQGGTKLEQRAYRTVAKESRDHVRALILGRTGRRIDLVSLLRQRRQDGSPVWALVDPTTVNYSNGSRDGDGNSLIPPAQFNGHLRRSDLCVIPVGGKCRDCEPGDGFPPLPAEARGLVTDPKIRERAEWVGVLYQPEEWREVDPDPAVIVKWRGVEGYHCLAVWGGDMPAIMEFVD